MPAFLGDITEKVKSDLLSSPPEELIRLYNARMDEDDDLIVHAIVRATIKALGLVVSTTGEIVEARSPIRVEADMTRERRPGELVEVVDEPTPCGCPACVSPASSIRPAGLVVARGDEDMLLPPGAMCRDCKSFTRCEWLISCSPTATMCDWSPSRFRPRGSPLPCRKADVGRSVSDATQAMRRNLYGLAR